MNALNAICWFAALLAITACILFTETRNANDGIEAQTFGRWIERHNTTVEDAQR